LFPDEPISTLLRSCQLNYPNGLNAIGFEIEHTLGELDKSQIESLLFLVSAQLGSNIGCSNIGNRLLLGDGVAKNIEQAAFWMNKCLEAGYKSQVRKKQMDEIYIQTKVFKKENPAFKKWTGNYESFLRQKIILL